MKHKRLTWLLSFVFCYFSPGTAHGATVHSFLFVHHVHRHGIVTRVKLRCHWLPILSFAGSFLHAYVLPPNHKTLSLDPPCWISGRQPPQSAYEHRPTVRTGHHDVATCKVGVVSLDGTIAVNFVVDPLSVPLSETLPDHFLAELDALAEAAGVDCRTEISACKVEAATLVRVMQAAVVAATPPTAS